MKHTLEVDSVILEFGTKRVLQDVYLKIETGNVLGLLGRNGSGKTCLMNIIYGEIKTNDKSIRINGESIIDDFRSPALMRYLPQFEFLPRYVTLKRIFKDFKLDFGDFVNEFPDLEKYYKMNQGKLSSGAKRIIEIYAILASETKFCMLDEPFSQVMPVHVEAIKNLILREKKNKGIVITDHLYKHIIDISDDLYVLNNGKTYLTRSLQDVEELGYARMDD